MILDFVSDLFSWFGWLIFLHHLTQFNIIIHIYISDDRQKKQADTKH